MDIEKINRVLGKAIMNFYDDEIASLSEVFRLPQYYKDNMKRIRAMGPGEIKGDWYRRIFDSLTDRQKEQIAKGSRIGRNILRKLGFQDDYYGGKAMQDILIAKIAKDIAKPKIDVPTPAQMHQKHGMPMGPAIKVPTPAQMHQKHGMPMGPVTFETVIKDVGDVFGVLRMTNRAPDKGKVKELLRVIPSQTSMMPPKSRKNVLVVLRHWLGVVRFHIKGVARSEVGNARAVRDLLKDTIKKVAEQRGGGSRAPRRTRVRGMSQPQVGL